MYIWDLIPLTFHLVFFLKFLRLNDISVGTKTNNIIIISYLFFLLFFGGGVRICKPQIQKTRVAINKESVSVNIVDLHHVKFKVCQNFLGGWGCAKYVNL